MVFILKPVTTINQGQYKFSRGNFVVWTCPKHNKERLWRVSGYTQKGYVLQSIACMGDTYSCGNNAFKSHETQRDVNEGELILYEGDECDMISEILDDFSWDGSDKHIQDFLFNHVLKNMKPCNNFKWEKIEGAYVISTKCSLVKGITWTISK